MTEPILPPDAARTLIRAATLAPSSHNTKPWLFRIGGAVVELLADRTRALPVNGPDDRELTISCGCAPFNLRVAAAAAALEVTVQALPDGADADLLACVRLAPGHAPGAEAALHDAIAARRTCRERFAPAPVDAIARQALAEAAALEGQPVQVTALRSEPQQLTGHAGCARLLLRIGTPIKAVPAAARRPPAEVLLAA